MSSADIHFTGSQLYCHCLQVRLIRQQIIVTKQSLFRVITRKLDFSCCSFDWFFPDRWAPVLTKSLQLVITPNCLKYWVCACTNVSLISSICCVWTCRNQCSQNSKKKQTEMENRKTSVRLLTFLMFGMPLCWMLFCVEKESGRECEGEISGAMPKLSLLQQIQSGTDYSYCPCSSHQSQQPHEKPCAERGRACRDVDKKNAQKQMHGMLCVDAYYGACGSGSLVVNFMTWPSDVLTCSYHCLISVLVWTFLSMFRTLYRPISHVTAVSDLFLLHILSSKKKKCK